MKPKRFLRRAGASEIIVASRPTPTPMAKRRPSPSLPRSILASSPFSRIGIARTGLRGMLKGPGDDVRGATGQHTDWRSVVRERSEHFHHRSIAAEREHGVVFVRVGLRDRRRASGRLREHRTSHSTPASANALTTLERRRAARLDAGFTMRSTRSILLGVNFIAVAALMARQLLNERRAQASG